MKRTAGRSERLGSRFSVHISPSIHLRAAVVRQAACFIFWGPTGDPRRLESAPFAGYHCCVRLQFRVCATCRHLEVHEQGREFPAIADTEFMVFHCRLLGWTTREDYLMAKVEHALPAAPTHECPHWEEHAG